MSASPYIAQDGFALYCGEAAAVLAGLPAESVHCIVTSPPYWSLRDYGHADQIGLEATPELYVKRLVEILEEAVRVLRPDGTLWLNLGDCYASSPPGNVAGVGATSSLNGVNDPSGVYRETLKAGHATKRSTVVGDLKPKDLVGIPWMVAFALRADGWYLRGDTIWHKGSGMPESVEDRPTSAHEHVFLLTRSARYFYDTDGYREPIAASTIADGRTASPFPGGQGGGNAGEYGHAGRPVPTYSTRNARSVWTINGDPYPGAHFAVMPRELARRCILLGTSEKGVCPDCGAPWQRLVEKGEPELGPTTWAPSGAGSYDDAAGEVVGRGLDTGSTLKHIVPRETVGWKPGCHCGHERGPDGEYGGGGPPAPVPAVVLDPFAGAGTTALVALEQGRRCIGIELSPEHCERATRRVLKREEAVLPEDAEPARDGTLSLLSDASILPACAGETEGSKSA